MTPFRPRSDAAHRSLGLLAVCLAAATMPLSFTGPAVALPAIAAELGGSPVALGWVTNAFMLAFGSSLMAAGALADRHGRRRVFLGGVAAFAAASVGLMLAPDLLTVGLLRAFQGAAGAAVYAGGAAALAQLFDGAASLRAFSWLGTSFGAGLVLGPVASGLLVEHFGWRSIFALVLILALPAGGLGLASLRESRDPGATRLDWPGAIGFTTSLGLFTTAVLHAPQRGWGDPWVLGSLAGAAIAAAAFVAIERGTARPMLDLSLFRYPRFVGAQLLAAAPAYAFVVLLVLLPVRFIGIDGLGEAAAGRWMMALSAPLLLLPLVAGRLSRFVSAATLCAVGLLLSAAGLAGLSRAAPADGAAAVLLPMALIGAGISLPWGLMDGLAVSVVPAERAGMATGIFSTIRVAGEGVALVLVGALLQLLTAHRLGAAGAAVRDAGAAAQRLSVGDLAGAAAALPGLSHAALVDAQAHAFSSLLRTLSAITAATALAVFAVLRSRRPPACSTDKAVCAAG